MQHKCVAVHVLLNVYVYTTLMLQISMSAMVTISVIKNVLTRKGLIHVHVTMDLSCYLIKDPAKVMLTVSLRLTVWFLTIQILMSVKLSMVDVNKTVSTLMDLTSAHVIMVLK